MAKTAAQRQAQYRARRVNAGPNGDGERHLNTWVATGAFLALRRLARRYGATKREMIERLVLDADRDIVSSMDIDTPEWDAYFNVTQ